MQQFDVVIVGGGMVGSALACALAPLGLTIAVIEKNKPRPFLAEQEMDLRVSAISVASEQLLTQLGAWSQITQMRCCPYRFLETWEAAGSNLVFDSNDMGAAHLGHIVENRLIQLALWQQMASFDNISLLVDESVSEFNKTTAGYDVTLGQQSISCRLLVGADGANSQVRQAAGIGITAWDYAQHAMLINITTSQEQQDITWQQFNPDGPLAFLPLAGNKASLVWYDSPARIRQLAALPHKQLQQQIIAQFPERLGQFEVDDCGAFPLTRRHAQTYYKDNLVLLGDAAHTINPLAGQGVNLGFKDVAALAGVISQAHQQGLNWCDQQQLALYQKQRRGDNLLMQSAMDMFYLTFSNERTVLKHLRNHVLKIAAQSAWGKKKVMKYAMGL